MRLLGTPHCALGWFTLCVLCGWLAGRYAFNRCKSAVSAFNKAVASQVSALKKASDWAALIDWAPKALDVIADCDVFDVSSYQMDNAAKIGAALLLVGAWGQGPGGGGQLPPLYLSLSPLNHAPRTPRTRLHAPHTEPEVTMPWHACPLCPGKEGQGAQPRAAQEGRRLVRGQQVPDAQARCEACCPFHGPGCGKPRHSPVKGTNVVPYCLPAHPPLFELLQL